MLAYQRLLSRSRECTLIGSMGALLQWDQQTYMPANAAAYRGEQVAYLAAMEHRLFTAVEAGDWLDECEQARPNLLSPVEKANVREWRRRYNRAVKIPATLVEEFARVTTVAHEAWQEAKRAKKFAIFCPHLEKILELRLRMADLWGYEASPYDALLDEYEPESKSAELAELFASLSGELTRLVAQGQWLYSQRLETLPPGPYPVAQQMAFNQRVLSRFGFDLQGGRVDATVHPFCSGMGPQDCRLTTRYEEEDFTYSLYSVLHEAGHGLYDQGLLKEYYGTPTGQAVSLGIHESQSRFWENHIARQSSFWEYWLPIATEYFPQLAKMTPQSMHYHVNRIRPGFIRVNADEVTYDLHIILRFNIESKLLNKTLTVPEVPEFWNQQFHQLFGMQVPDDALGCLQDVHWSGGMIGYFPTYTLGNMNAAQLADRISTELPDLPEMLRAGEYGDVLSWLRQKIHRFGSVYTPSELMQEATGETTNPVYHLRYLRSKIH